jgi:hypothetical protein
MRLHYETLGLGKGALVALRAPRALRPARIPARDPEFVRDVVSLLLMHAQLQGRADASLSRQPGLTARRQEGGLAGENVTEKSDQISR